MSFQDPDQREAWEKAGRESREKCRKAGGCTYIGSGERCNVCSVTNPERVKPHVTLTTDDLRAVFDPRSGNVTIERRGRDSVGAERWDAIDTIHSKHTRAEDNRMHLITLLSKGRVVP